MRLYGALTTTASSAPVSSNGKGSDLMDEVNKLWKKHDDEEAALRARY